MEHSDTLLTIAELAVALAGFASLVSVIGRRQNNTSRAVDSIRLQMMLEVAFRNACAYSKFVRRAYSAFRVSVSGPYAASLQTYRW